jgi:hypothetical protein
MAAPCEQTVAQPAIGAQADGSPAEAHSWRHGAFRREDTVVEEQIGPRPGQERHEALQQLQRGGVRGPDGEDGRRPQSGGA